MHANSDAFAPAEIAQRVEELGVHKARASTLALLPLGVLAGAFISLGAIFALVVTTGSTLGYGPTRLFGGVAFSLGLILVVVGGAELFTGNNLVAMAWASRRISTRELVRNWILVYAGNLVGAFGTAALVLFGGVADWGSGEVAATAVAVGASKAALGPLEGIALGILCNTLVCLAVWLAIAGRSVADKVIGIVPPVAAFVACGFEHSIANAFFLPLAGALGANADPAFVPGALRNLGCVTLGNVIGGTLLVAAVYWAVYLRPRTSAMARPGAQEDS